MQVKEQSSQVWRFILDREVEAPARFCAIQTHRASLAVLFQQVACNPFVIKLVYSCIIIMSGHDTACK